jgi:hypothetical protein
MRSGSRLCFITTCMGRLSSLEVSLPTLTCQPEGDVVVVDYSCPDRSGDWVERHHPGCRVARVPQREFFHLSHARNVGLAARPPDADWVCFVDADVCLSPSFSATVAPLLAPGRFLVTPMHPRNRGLAGLILARAEDVSRCGGFDEAYENYGRQAGAMRVALFASGLTPVFLPDGLARHLGHGDDVRSRNYREKDLVRSTIQNSRRLRALVERTERATGKEVPPELCLKWGESPMRAALRGALHEVSTALRRLWRSGRAGA